MANANSSGDSDTDLPGSDDNLDEVTHADGGFKKFYSSVKKLSKRIASISESPVASPVSTEKTGHFTDIPSSPRGQSGDTVFGNFDDPSVTGPSDSVYNFNYRSRGVAVLIVNVTFLHPKMSPNRPYAKYDIEVFEKILNALHFTVIKLKDRTTAELQQRLEEIRSTLTSDCDCFFCLISSHGLETRISSDKRKRQHMTFTYDRWIPTEKIIRPFTESYCRPLRGKPKLFFIQACRSVHNSADCDSVDRGIRVTEAVRGPQSRRRDVRDNPAGTDIGRDRPMVHPVVVDGQGDINGSSEDLSQSIRGKANLDEIPFADEDDTEDSDDPDLSAADNPRVAYYPPRPRHSDDVDVCTIPCYPHCLVMFSSAPERFAWSDDFKGGWLPYCMYNVLYKMAQRNFRIDLLEALTEVNKVMAESLETHSPSDKVIHKMKSAACIYHMLTKDIYFTPKYAPVPVLDRVQVSAV